MLRLFRMLRIATAARAANHGGDRMPSYYYSRCIPSWVDFQTLAPVPITEPPSLLLQIGVISQATLGAFRGSLVQSSQSMNKP